MGVMGDSSMAMPTSFIPTSLNPLSAQTQSHDQTEQGWLAARAVFLYEGCDELEAFQTRD